MMTCARVCVLMLTLVSPALSDGQVWLKMTDTAVSTASTDTVMREPDKVFDLSDLVMKTNQFEIYSVDVHSPGFITSQVLVSRVTNGLFNGTWTVSSLMVDVTGQASFLGRTFRIDSRVAIKDSSLRLAYRQDAVLLVQLAGCDFTFQIESITMRDRSLQSFVSIWKSQFLGLPPRAICYRMGILHRQHPLYLFGISEDRLKNMTTTAVALKDSAIWIAFQRRGPDVGGTSVGSPPDITLDSPSSLTVFFPQRFLADFINSQIDAILQTQFVSSKSARIKLTALVEYFEMDESLFEDRADYTGVFSLDLNDQGFIITTDGLMSTTVSTLHYKVSSECGEYHLFSLNWKLDTALNLIYNDQSLFLRVGDIRSEVTVTKSSIGKPKNLPKLIKDVQIHGKIKGGIFEDLAFFLDNTAVLSNTVLAGYQNYLILQSDTTRRPAVKPWEEFGTGFTGERVKVINNENLTLETVDLCGKPTADVSSSSGSAVWSRRILVLMFLAIKSTCAF